jgi:hypothetical protein
MIARIVHSRDDRSTCSSAVDVFTQPHTGAVFVRHEGNVASGGHVQHIELGPFLSSGGGPEQQELLRLIATLLDEAAHA